MPPQQQSELLFHHSPLKSRPSDRYSVARFPPLEVPSMAASTTSTTSNGPTTVSHGRAAEAWISRRNVTPSPRDSRSDSRDRSDSPVDSSGGSSVEIPVRTSLRERLQARMKEPGSKRPEPLHAEATLRLLTKGLTQMSPPPPPPAPHTTPVSNVGRKSPQELDTCLASESTECESKQALRNPPPPRVSARSRSPKSPVEETKKKQKMSTSAAVTHIMEALAENQHRDAQAAAHASLLRLSRQVKYGSKVETNAKKANSIKLHIYDLLTTETYMQLGWGCEFPIGQCFNAMNDGLHLLGTGAYHCGIEINGIEYAYGANNSEGTTGVFSCIPKHSPGFEYRTTLEFGTRPLIKRAWVRVPEKGKETSVYREVVSYVDGREVMKEMAKEYLGPDYDLLRRNCCTFARDAALRLGIEEDEIPTWFMNLADAGAATQDAAAMTLKPITSMLSGIDDDDDSIIDRSGEEEEGDSSESGGFEVICKPKKGRHEMEIVQVIETLNMDNMERVAAETSYDGSKKGPIEVRRTNSWTY